MVMTEENRAVDDKVDEAKTTEIEGKEKAITTGDIETEDNEEETKTQEIESKEKVIKTGEI